jgi:hypothetical protein
VCVCVCVCACSKLGENHGKSSYFVETKINCISHVFVIFTKSFLVLELFLVLEPTI